MLIFLFFIISFRIYILRSFRPVLLSTLFNKPKMVDPPFVKSIECHFPCTCLPVKTVQPSSLSYGLPLPHMLPDKPILLMMYSLRFHLMPMKNLFIFTISFLIPFRLMSSSKSWVSFSLPQLGLCSTMLIDMAKNSTHPFWEVVKSF